MSDLEGIEPDEELHQAPLERDPEAYAPSVAKRLAFYQRAGGIITPFLTAVFAFLMGGIVVGATGHNPLRVYKAIFEGAGLNWFLHFGNYHVDVPLTNHHIWFWWDTNTNHTAAYNLTQTLLTTTPLILTGLAVAFAFRCGLFNIGGQQNHVDKSIPISDDIAQNAHFPDIWGNPALQALHAGIFVALAALIVFYLVLNRTTLGYQVRAVGFNPEAARYGGISVGRNFIVAMAISGVFAGLAGGLDILGWQFRLGVLDVQVSNIGFIGIAVALLGRNTAVGVGLAALLFGGLLTGTSTRSLDPDIFPPQLAGNLALMIQALVLLFVGADLLIIYIWQARRKLRLPGAARAARESA